MTSSHSKRGPYPKAFKGAEDARLHVDSPQTRSPSYKLAFQDGDFLLRDELRPVRLELELLKPELIIREHNVESTIVIFGSARIPNPEAARERFESARAELSRNPDAPELKKKFKRAERALTNCRYYEEARKLAKLISLECQCSETLTHVVMTGGGPGIMEAANRGAMMRAPRVSG